MKWQIGNIEIKNRVVLAPMAGTSNPAYIKICAEMGIGYAITELISSEAIIRDNKKTFEMLEGIDKLDIPVAIQLFGSNPEVLANAAKIITQKYKVSMIDINMGCPVPKVAIHANSGSALLKNPELVGKIVSTVSHAINIPVTVKIRSGWDHDHINAPEIAKICEENGAKAITIHARTKTDGYTGKVDLDVIKEVKSCVNIPVIGNGDIKNPEDAQKMLEYTKCDAIMIGRASLGNPWIFKKTIAYLNNNKILPEPTPLEKINMIKTHYNLLKETKNEHVALLEIRTHALYYLKGLPDAKPYKERICTVKTEEELNNILVEYTNSLIDI